MKLKYIALALAGLLCGTTFTGCSEDDVREVNLNAIPLAADYANSLNIVVDQETNNVTFSFSAPGVYPVWIIDGKTYSTQHTFTRYYRKAGEYNIELKIGNSNGISQGTIQRSFQIEKTMMNGFGGFVYESEYNLWTKATKQINSFYYAPNWAQLPDPAHSFDGETYNVQLSAATFERWQAQCHIGTDISLNEGESYDGSFIFTSTQDINNIVLKIHPLGDDDDNHSFFCAQKINLTAGEPICYWFSDLTAVVPMNDVVFTLDFGGNPDNCEITIENFVLKSHANDDGTVLPELPSVPEPTWVSASSAENLWNGLEITPSFYYAPNWAQLPDPTLTFDGNDFTIALPQATFDRWQAQVVLNTNLAIPADGKTYDFCITYESNTGFAVMTKLTQTDEDNNFLFAEETQLAAGGMNKYWISGAAVGADMPSVKLVLDFGGNPDGTEVKVSNIILQEHHD